jgi:hypothetical protein
VVLAAAVFSNIMPAHFLEELAEADEHEVVQQVQVHTIAIV